MRNQFIHRLRALYHNEALRFVVVFLVLFCIFNYGNKFLFSVFSANTNHYNQFISEHFNYIQGLRTALIISSVGILRLFDYTVLYNSHQILALNGITCNINYSCLGLGVMSFWVAFVIAFPKPLKEKVIFMVYGLVAINLLNIVRFVSLIGLTVEVPGGRKYFDYQHDAFNYTIYIVLFTMIYFWVKNYAKVNPVNNLA